MTDQAALESVRAALATLEVPVEDGTRAGELVLTLPGEHKLRTVCSLLVGARDLSVQAFVIRHPDERHEEVYRLLLRRNLRLRSVAYAVDAAGDVYLTGRVPLAGLDTAALDRLLGEVLAASDGPFDELLALGFLTAMRREWAWRLDRGESTANLEAFRHLLETGEAGSAAADPGSA